MEHEVVNFDMVKYRGMLCQLCRDIVRKTFLSGNFGCLPNSLEVLSSLDIIRDILLPPPLAGYSQSAAMTFAGKLMSKEESEPLDQNGNFLPYRQNFSEWKACLRAMMTCIIWERLNGQDTDDTLKYQQKPSSAARSSFGTSNKKSSPQMAYRSNELNISNDKKPKIKATQSLDESSSYDDQRLLLPSDHVSFSGRNWVNGDADTVTLLISALRKMRVQKEVMAPTPFDPRKHGSFAEFLSSFERYFDSKYDGTAREKSAQLSKYLCGAAKLAYDAMGGGSIKYGKLKPKLLEWYTATRRDSIELGLEEFTDAHMLPNEAFLIYCLRLEKLAHMAFGACQDNEIDLLNKFRETAPSAIVGRLRSVQTIMATITGDKLTWLKLKRFAGECDREKDECYRQGTRKAPEPETGPLLNSYRGMSVARKNNFNDRMQKTRVFTSSRLLIGSSEPPIWERNAHQKSMASKRSWKPCEWCGRKGHMLRRCWKRLGSCTSYGQRTHSLWPCPISHPTVPKGNICCPNCHVSHLGKNCPSSVSECEVKGGELTEIKVESKKYRHESERVRIKSSIVGRDCNILASPKNEISIRCTDDCPTVTLNDTCPRSARIDPQITVPSCEVPGDPTVVHSAEDGLRNSGEVDSVSSIEDALRISGEVHQNSVISSHFYDKLCGEPEVSADIGNKPILMQDWTADQLSNWKVNWVMFYLTIMPKLIIWL